MKLLNNTGLGLKGFLHYFSSQFDRELSVFISLNIIFSPILYLFHPNQVCLVCFRDKYYLTVKIYQSYYYPPKSMAVKKENKFVLDWPRLNQCFLSSYHPGSGFKLAHNLFQYLPHYQSENDWFTATHVSHLREEGLCSLCSFCQGTTCPLQTAKGGLIIYILFKTDPLISRAQETCGSSFWVSNFTVTIGCHHEQSQISASNGSVASG